MTAPYSENDHHSLLAHRPAFNLVRHSDSQKKLAAWRSKALKQWLGRFSVPAVFKSWRHEDGGQAPPAEERSVLQQGGSSQDRGKSHRQTQAASDDGTVDGQAYRQGQFQQSHGNDRLDDSGMQHGLNGSSNEQSQATLKDLAKQPSPILHKASAIFPFALFPDTVTVDTDQVCVLRRVFFWAHTVSSVNHADILNVTVESGPFFATLKITTRFFQAPMEEVEKLTTRDAHMLRKLIHGLMVVKRQNVAFDDSNPDKLRQQLLEIGEVNDRAMP